MSYLRLFLFVASVLVYTGSTSAQKNQYISKETDAYIASFHKTAIQNMYIYGIPASITLAQGILESGSGGSDLALKANNHFGIKCKSDYTGKPYYKHDDGRTECFRTYKSASESYTDHSIFLTSRPNYTELFSLSVTDYKSWAFGLKKCGYATDPAYPQRLIGIIEANKLYVYDLNPEKYVTRDDVKKDKVLPANHVPQIQNGKINGVKCVVVQPGQTLWGIAHKLGMQPQQIRDFNDLEKNYVLKVGDVVYLQTKKRRYYESKYHYAQEGETMRSIAQLYGLQLSVFKEMNKVSGNWIPKGKRLLLHY